MLNKVITMPLLIIILAITLVTSVAYSIKVIL